MGTRKNAIAAKAKLDKPIVAGTACFAISWREATWRLDTGTTANDKLGSVRLSAKNWSIASTKSNNYRC